MKNIAISVLTALLLCMPVLSSGQTPIRLYDGVAPGSETWTHEEAVFEYMSPFWNEVNSVVLNVVDPVLIPYLPAAGLGTGVAVVICPGGGFSALSYSTEGPQVAEWFAAHGIAAFVLKYRVSYSGGNPEELRSVVDHTYGGVPQDDAYKALAQKNREYNKEKIGDVRHLAADDARQAVKYLRNNASAYGIDPDRIAMVGFSAGGALALDVLYDHDESSKPNLVGLVYGAMAKAEMPSDPCPLFIAATQYEIAGLSYELYSLWCKNRLPAEIHSFTSSRHGFGYRPNGAPENMWIQLFYNYMETLGFLKRKGGGRLVDIPDSPGKGNPAMQQRKQDEDWPGFKRYEKANAALTVAPDVVLMGDSITDNWFTEDPDFFTENNFAGRGISGQTASQMLCRFRQDVIALKPKIVAIMAGTNDICQQMAGMAYYPDANIVGNIISMCELAQAAGIKVILCSITPCSSYMPVPHLDAGARIVEINSRLKEYAESCSGVTWLDYFTPLANSKNGFDKDQSYDGVHPVITVYHDMEKILAGSVSAILRPQSPYYVIPLDKAQEIKKKKDVEWEERMNMFKLKNNQK